jgi:hypothetical protein
MRPNHRRLETAKRAAAPGQAVSFRQGTIEPLDPLPVAVSPVLIGSPAARPICPQPSRPPEIHLRICLDFRQAVTNRRFGPILATLIPAGAIRASFVCLRRP